MSLPTGYHLKDQREQSQLICCTCITLLQYYAGSKRPSYKITTMQHNIGQGTATHRK